MTIRVWVARSRSLSETQNELVEFAQGLDGVREVNKSDVVAKTLSSCECACSDCVYRDYRSYCLAYLSS